MTDFQFYDEYDKEVANEGVWFQGIDRAGNNYGSFLCRLIDRDQPATKTFFNRQGNKKQNVVSEEKQTEDTIRMFIECSLLDWDLKDIKGKPIEFDKKKAFEYFSNPKTHTFLMNLIQYSSDVNNYTADEELPEKNL